MNGGQYAPCASPLVVDGLGDGVYSIVARAVDAAGNVDPDPVVATFAVDMPPDTVVVAGPIGLIDSPDATFVFGGTTASDSFECSLNGASFLPCPSVHNVVGLGPGEHVLDVRAVDIGGERDPTLVSASWTVVTLAAAPARSRPTFARLASRQATTAPRSAGSGPEESSFGALRSCAFQARRTRPARSFIAATRSRSSTGVSRMVSSIGGSSTPLTRLEIARAGSSWLPLHRCVRGLDDAQG